MLNYYSGIGTGPNEENLNLFLKRENCDLTIQEFSAIRKVIDQISCRYLHVRFFSSEGKPSTRFPLVKETS